MATIETRVSLPTADARAATLAPPHPRAVWGMLFARSALFLATQAALAAVLAFAAVPDFWRAGADWWLATAAIADVLCLVLLGRLLRREGLGWRDLFHLAPGTRPGRREVPWLIGLVVLGVPAVLIASDLVGKLLWGSNQVAAEMSFRPLPVAAALVLVALPILNGISEMPTYYGYVMPRLQALYGRRYTVLVLVAMVLSLQHVFLPFLLDGRFILFKAVAFLPYSLLFGFVILKRPRILPWAMVFHALSDSSLWLMTVLVSMG